MKTELTKREDKIQEIVAAIMPEMRHTMGRKPVEFQTNVELVVRVWLAMDALRDVFTDAEDE